MKISGIILSFLTISFYACSQKQVENHHVQLKEKVETPILDSNFTLADYYGNNSVLDQKVVRIFNQLDDTGKVAQLIMPAMGRLGQPTDVIFRLVRERKIGGILMLNGTKEQFKSWIDSINSINKELGVLPYFFSADAEPSLINRKIIGSTPVKKANQLQNIGEVKACAETIANDLKLIGINYDFAPVVDMSKNATVGWRSFGLKPEHNIPWSTEFIQVLQSKGIIATAKHFPGHGLVTGDTHKSLQTIDGELKEIKNYPPLINQNLLSIMIGHLAVVNNHQYDTQGLPATLSKVIVTDLLRNSMKFKGLIITDAMNMGGVANVPNCEEKAVAAGCDIVLMPINTDKAFKDIYSQFMRSEVYRQQVNDSVKRIIRMKICLGLL